MCAPRHGDSTTGRGARNENAAAMSCPFALRARKRIFASLPGAEALATNVRALGESQKQTRPQTAAGVREKSIDGERSADLGDRLVLFELGLDGLDDPSDRAAGALDLGQELLRGGHD